MSAKALVADDDRAMRTLIVQGLNAVGAPDATEAADGDEALALFGQHAFDLLVLDWEMPGKTGLEVLQAIRAAGSEVPVLMVTAQAGKKRVVEAIRAGASDYLAKPFDLDSLEDKLRKYCQPAGLPEDVAIYRVGNVMNTKVVTIREDTTVGEAISLLLQHGISGLPVVDAEEKLVGVITELQLLRTVYHPEITTQVVSELMTRQVLSVKEDTILSAVADLMERRRVRRLPVVRNGQVVGIIARRDLLRYVTENEEALSEFLRSVRSALGA